MHYQRKQHFTSFDEFNSAPHGWDTDFSSTARDNYKVSLKHSSAPGLLINTAWLSSPTLQQASTPEGMRTFALPLQQPGPYCWRGLPVNERTLMVFPSDRELFSMMGGNSEILTISLEQRMVDRCLQDWEVDPDAMFSRPRTLELSELQREEFRRSLSLLTEFIIKYGDHRQFPHLSHGIQEYLVENMLQPVMENLERPGISHTAAAKRVKRAADYILARLDQPLSVEDVCNHAGCSRRSLEQCFRRYAGTSPKQFIQLMRLKSCRTALHAAASDSRVSNIARQHGYWHMGQFAADYRRLFRETPSQTLRRAN